MAYVTKTSARRRIGEADTTEAPLLYLLPMPASYEDEVRFGCRRMYCLQRMSLEEIAEVKDPSLSTLRRWRAEGSWDDQRVKQALSGPMLAQALMLQINQIVQTANDEGRAMTKGECDKVAKLQKVASRHAKDARYTSHVIEAMDQLQVWLGSNYPDLRPQMVTPLNEFAHHVANSASA